MTLFLVLLLPGLVALVLLRNQFRREAQRQRAIRWPKAAAVFQQRFDRLPSAEGATQGEAMQYRPRFPESYVFYVKGSNYRGRAIMPAPPSALEPEYERELMEELAEHRVFYVRFNTEDPSENYLTAGFAGLTWPRVILYAYLVVGFPLLFWRVFRWTQDVYGFGQTSQAILVAFFGFAFLLVVLLYQLWYPRHSMRGIVEGVYPEEPLVLKDEESVGTPESRITDEPMPRRIPMIEKQFA